MNLPSRFLALMLSLTATLHAGPRASSDYSVVTDAISAGGNRTTSASYTSEGSIGLVAGLSTVAAPAEVAKSGYLAQLYEVTGFTLTATSLNIDEGGTDQLAGWQTLDDTTFLSVPATSVAWSVLNGPLTSIGNAGLATAATVYQDTSATARGNFLGTIATLALTVKNVSLDNFSSYAGDQIDDAWQVQYFGQPPNANAGPSVDFDSTGQTNFFKYIAGLNPLDGSRFTLTITPVPGQPTQKALIFFPRLSDRTYVVTSTPNLTAGYFVPLTNPSPPSDNGTQRTITDPDASGPAKFYRVEITKP